ncbi:lytic polysaccharide monooxygenase [Plenodomus tracheiphilus IPT5]|uniref:AA9 family lytic polysaccharide monooxygenase n=1 Tax=Plenodomus tracheiphilus IPT5 TaxID=1408161 RepID=A0A6A7AXP6_9PLEO|nr:lytic polysaccharide monooxygenase [Plenodomus tracheiphilus IPT5]
MRFSTAIAIALSATASLVAAQAKCEAQNIVDACVSGYQSRIAACNLKPNDYICMCDVYTDVLVCYNNCPKSNEKPPVQNQVTQFCQAAQPLRAAQSASVASAASVAATQSHASTAASATATVTGSATGSGSAASPSTGFGKRWRVVVKVTAGGASMLALQTEHGVFVNGVDQGTFRGVRIPAYNGQNGKGGYNNGPVKDLDSIDLSSNVLGDIQAHDTIQFAPGDHLTFDWHHEVRNDTDDVIASSHHGPPLVYISPDPPTENSFVKLWHSGKYESHPFPQPGKWPATSDIAKNFGHMNARIPKDLKAGYAEMIALHEGDVSYKVNPRRGAQFYPDCVQIDVIGDGTVELPAGVSFPGAYNYNDPGVVHNVYCSTQTKKATTSPTPCVTEYMIPGPTVWEGAWPETTVVSIGPIKGLTTATPWSTWIGTDSTLTSVTYADVKSQTIMGSKIYTASWSAVYSTPTGAGPRW